MSNQSADPKTLAARVADLNHLCMTKRRAEEVLALAEEVAAMEHAIHAVDALKDRAASSDPTVVLIEAFEIVEKALHG